MSQVRHEKLSLLDFVDKNIGDLMPVMPSSIEDTPFKLVEEVRDLKELAAKLRCVNEFAVDLEHNQYRSFQG
ncbi:Protein RRP6-like 2 [Vitis vinifera]|uniref:Protein RRP6-like 2 n=1 Tax=Vitis vinifera TaxID=29760 RepID=A0A438DH61_VITVI|nr:Protein RRP6-like 2 [Vitis vinifera]